MEKRKKSQFNKLIYDDLIERFNAFVGKNSRIFKGRDKDSKAACLVFEAGLDVCENQSEKLKNKENE